jgi:hypothetical protein
MGSTVARPVVMTKEGRAAPLRADRSLFKRCRRDRCQGRSKIDPFAPVEN